MTVRYDPRDLAETRIYHHGVFLCRAVAPDITAATISMQDLPAARNERRRELREQLTARRSLVDMLNHPATRVPQAARPIPDRQVGAAKNMNDRAKTVH